MAQHSILDIFEPIYAVFLEDYSCPRYVSTYRAYVGTMDDILKFADRLESLEGMAKRYEKLIHGIRHYEEEPRARHVINGFESYIMVPAEEVYRREFLLKKHRWNHEAHDGTVYPVRADEVWISQIVVQVGDCYMRFSRAYFENLQVFYQGAGWVKTEKYAKGFPGMVYKEDDITYLTLYGDEDVQYELSKKEKAIGDVHGWMDYDMHHVMRDIIGEG